MNEHPDLAFQRVRKLAWVGILLVSFAIPLEWLSNSVTNANDAVFASNLSIASVFFATVCFITVTIALLIIPEKTPGLCDHCQYNLTGNQSGICPECGNGI